MCVTNRREEKKGRHERKWKTKQNLLLYRCAIEVVKQKILNPIHKKEEENRY